MHLNGSAMCEATLLILAGFTFLGYVGPLRHPRQREDHPIDRSDHLDTMLGPATIEPFDHRKESLHYLRRSSNRHRENSPSPAKRSVTDSSETPLVNTNNIQGCGINASLKLLRIILQTKENIFSDRS
jgi:hypothetical protein